MLSLNDYRSVIAVFEERHFARAADRLAITQPALTARLRRIEEIIGVRLFTRGRAGVTPTDAGIAFVEGAQQVLDTADLAEQAAKAAHAGFGVMLRIGTTDIAAAQMTTRCLRAFRDSQPEARIRLSIGTTAALERQLEQGAIDLAFLHPPLHAPGLSQKTYVSAPLSRDDYGNATSDTPDILYPRDEAPILMAAMDRLVADDAPTPMATADTASAAVILSRAGYGPAILPQGFELPGTRAVTSIATDMNLDTCIAWRSLDRRPVIRAFLDLADGALTST